MYGVNESIRSYIEQFHGQYLQQIGLNPAIVWFYFDAGQIGIEGKWELRDHLGLLIDQAEPNESREAYRVHSLLMLKVVASRMEPPSWFELEFESGHILRVYDDSDQYESFSITPGNVIV